jgi:hypothetical protein
VRSAFNEFFQSKAHTFWASNAVVSMQAPSQPPRQLTAFGWVPPQSMQCICSVAAQHMGVAAGWQVWAAVLAVAELGNRCPLPSTITASVQSGLVKEAELGCSRAEPAAAGGVTVPGDMAAPGILLCVFLGGGGLRYTILPKSILHNIEINMRLHQPTHDSCQAGEQQSRCLASSSTVHWPTTVAQAPQQRI